uniref:Protein GPR107 n=1 Tax=Cacopsylla melanoneura TaxID=428564 RepID=A0A8D8V6D1_9HEMI
MAKEKLFARMTINIVPMLVLGILVGLAQGRIHKLTITNDDRRFIALSTFGFLKGGILDINLINFQTYPSAQENYTVGFSLDRTMSDAMSPYLDAHPNQCLLEDPSISAYLVYFVMDIKSKTLKVRCGSDMSNLHIYKDMSNLPPVRAKRASAMGDKALFANRRILMSNTGSGGNPKLPQESEGVIVPTNGGVNAPASEGDVLSTCQSIHLPLVFNEKGQINASFVIFIASEAEEGLYNLYLHNCENYRRAYWSEGVKVNFTIHIREENVQNFLSAGEMPLPALYLTMSLLFCLSGSFWLLILQKSSHPVYKIHYLMAVLVYIKALALLFHSINFHFLQTKGEHVAAWAILYYITHVLRGSVLFITMALIGTGWTFIKHILSSREKKVFMIVIPLQVLANVAQIIIEESEEGDAEYGTWLKVFMSVDLLCCGLIMFPVVWSIRHLQEASHTDGKAAMNLRKLKLFRHFYVMIVVYIYFTRIIVYLIRMTIPFQYEWMDEMFKEMSTYVFFVLTGYKFRPTSTNPYFQRSLAEYEDDEDVDLVISEYPMAEGLSKLTRINQKERADEGEYDTEKTTMLQKKESSHEYD